MIPSPGDIVELSMSIRSSFNIEKLERYLGIFLLTPEEENLTPSAWTYLREVEELYETLKSRRLFKEHTGIASGVPHLDKDRVLGIVVDRFDPIRIVKDISSKSLGSHRWNPKLYEFHSVASSIGDTIFSVLCDTQMSCFTLDEINPIYASEDESDRSHDHERLINSLSAGLKGEK